LRPLTVDRSDFGTGVDASGPLPSKTQSAETSGFMTSDMPTWLF
jgi:hypothetical protein